MIAIMHDYNHTKRDPRLSRRGTDTRVSTVGGWLPYRWRVQLYTLNRLFCQSLGMLTLDQLMK